MAIAAKYGIVAPVIDDALVRLGYGSCSALAWWCGVARTTVTRWRDGTAAPSPRYWAAIEQFLELQPGTIADLVEGVGGGSGRGGSGEK